VVLEAVSTHLGCATPSIGTKRERLSLPPLANTINALQGVTCHPFRPDGAYTPTDLTVIVSTDYCHSRPRRGTAEDCERRGMKGPKFQQLYVRPGR
jgi:hypothetical protein